MAVAARINPTWAWKWAIVSTAMLLFGAWCLYDFYVAYPEHDRKVTRFQELKELGRLSEWPKIAAEQGWSDADPGEKHYQEDATGKITKDDYSTQWYQFYIVVPLGLAGFGWLLFNLRRPLAADEEHLIAPSGKKVPWAAITALDKKRWDRKGIAIVHYADGGDKGTVTIDDWVYRDADLVLAEVEAHTGLTGDEEPLEEEPAT